MTTTPSAALSLSTNPKIATVSTRNSTLATLKTSINEKKERDIESIALSSRRYFLVINRTQRHPAFLWWFQVYFSPIFSRSSPFATKTPVYFICERLGHQPSLLTLYIGIAVDSNLILSSSDLFLAVDCSLVPWIAHLSPQSLSLPLLPVLDANFT